MYSKVHDVIHSSATVNEYQQHDTTKPTSARNMSRVYKKLKQALVLTKATSSRTSPIQKFLEDLATI